MARLAIGKDFLGDFSKLEKPVQSAVMAVFDKFEEHTFAGLHLEKLNHPKDQRIRTIRIGGSGVVSRSSGSGEILDAEGLTYQIEQKARGARRETDRHLRQELAGLRRTEAARCWDGVRGAIPGAGSGSKRSSRRSEERAKLHDLLTRAGNSAKELL